MVADEEKFPSRAKQFEVSESSIPSSLHTDSPTIIG